MLPEHGNDVVACGHQFADEPVAGKGARSGKQDFHVTVGLSVAEMPRRIEVAMTCVPWRHESRRHRPGNRKSRIVPSDSALERRGIEFIHQVQELRRIFKGDEAVSESLWYEHHCAVRR